MGARQRAVRADRDIVSMIDRAPDVAMAVLAA